MTLGLAIRARPRSFSLSFPVPPALPFFIDINVWEMTADSNILVATQCMKSHYRSITLHTAIPRLYLAGSFGQAHRTA